MDEIPVIDILNRHASEFHSVVNFDPSKEKLLLFEFAHVSANILDDTKTFIDYVNVKLNAAGAKFGIGGYDEKREVYSRSKVFNQEGKEPRRIHLGIDIWGKPYTAVMAPLDGVIHSFAFNNNFGDYGATLIISHNLDGISFHTLYGHLSLNSIRNLREGGNVRNGDVIAEFGIPFENGQWPPHLHFQIIIDMEFPTGIGRRGDYPGVCAESEREKYLKNSPDPDLILQMMRYAS
jgi:murein DD-endopeptidase MepM/ murein hydrolase activator NlpD